MATQAELEAEEARLIAEKELANALALAKSEKLRADAAEAALHNAIGASRQKRQAYDAELTKLRAERDDAVAKIDDLNPVRRSGRLPRQQLPARIAQDYARALAGYVRRVEIVFEPLFSELPRLLEDNRAERADAGEATRIQELIALAESVLRRSLSNEEIENLALRFANAVQIHQKSQLARQIRAAFGIDVFINDRRLASTMEGFVAENTQLIRRIPLDVAAKVGGVVTRGVTAGKLHRDIAKDVESEYGFGRKRAKLIARDQVGKFYGQTNATRQKDLGVTEFIWRTSRDRRVRGTPGGAFPSARPSHYHLEGKRFSYDNPPHGELPGEPVLCRCWAEPVFDTATDVFS